MLPENFVLLSYTRRMRYELTLWLLESGRPHAVPEMADLLTSRGWAFSGRPSKVVSDALRTEVQRGRVVRVGRGRCQTGVVARGTEWWLRTWLEEWDRWCARQAA